MIKQWKPYLAGLAMGVALGVGAVWGGVGVLNEATPPDTGNAIAKDFGVSIVWTNDFRNCGAFHFTEGGCFSPATPDTIYVSPHLDVANKQYVILHEIGHVVQLRFKIPQDECGADRFAQATGGTILGVYCRP